MTNFNVRPGCPADASELAKLRYDLRSRSNLGRFHTPSQEEVLNLASDFVLQSRSDAESETEFLDRCTTWMQKALQQSNWRCWVAERDRSLIGALWLQVIEKIPNPSAESESYAYITNFYVNESARGQGIGSAVLEEALRWCCLEKVHGVILWPTERSRSLYQRHGFKVNPDLLELLIESE
jgi:GNAT superfamily N-acetyltransferase